MRLRRWAAFALAIVVGMLLAAAWSSRSAPPAGLDRAAPRPPQDAVTVARGAYLARLGNCAGCHTRPGGEPFAGPRGITTPFGTVYAGNLTPDDDTGLGRWSAEDFWQALHHGRSRDGRALIPAFPYTEFTKVTRSDSDALWTYLRSLPAVAQSRPEHELAFPYNTAAAIAAWRAIYFEPGVFVPDPARPPQWNRGAYLAQGLGHCAACHAPRDRWGGRGEALSGGVMAGERWWAPALGGTTQDAEQTIALLATGQSSQGAATGPMAEVVVQSTQHWSDADRRAITEYLGSLHNEPSATAAATPRTPIPEQGRRLYNDRCADCHGSHGEGVAGIYPPLAGNPSVLQTNPINLVHVLRHGGFAPATQANPRPFGMPPSDLDDEAMAAVLTYVRRSWGNNAPDVSALQVLRAR